MKISLESLILHVVYALSDVAGRLDNDVDMIALEEELAALTLQKEGEPHPHTCGCLSIQYL